MESDIPFRNLTIYLTKEGRSQNSLIRSKAGTKEFRVPVGGGVHARLIVKEPTSKPPRWASFFTGEVNPVEFGEVSSCSAVLLVPIKSRWAAVTFGQGRYLLGSESLEDRFGLRVALNCIDNKKIKTIDKQTFDAIARHTKEQSSRDANAGEFGFDIERDMLRAVTGTPQYTTLGARLTGMDALSTNVRIELSGLGDLISRYHEKFLDKSYKKNFSWVDQIAEVSDVTLRDTLDNLVLGMITGGNFERCWLAVPEIIDWSRVSGFRYLRGDRAPEYNDIHLRTFLESVRDSVGLTMLRLKQRKVFCFGDNDQLINDWSVFRCLYCELDYQGSSYVLSAGKWYRLEKDFVRQVNDSFMTIKQYSGTFPEYDDDNEAAYNTRLAKATTDYCLMDRNLTYRGGAIEICDIFSRAKQLIHIKRYSGSGGLSHLFFQGAVSGEYFQADEEFRRLFRDKLPKGFQVFDIKNRPNFEEYEVVFGVVSQSNKPLWLPFFSRVAARQAVRRLILFGYRVSLSKIAVAETRKKLKRYKAASKKKF